MGAAMEAWVVALGVLVGTVALVVAESVWALVSAWQERRAALAQRRWAELVAQVSPMLPEARAERADRQLRQQQVALPTFMEPSLRVQPHLAETLQVVRLPVVETCSQSSSAKLPHHRV
jgi:predicted membrane chloride channel (bestrophin family)